MIILDTNVISEIQKPQQNEKLIAWLDEIIPNERLYTTALNIAELRLGVDMLPNGRRKDALTKFVDQVVTQFSPDFILPFDDAAAEIYAPLTAKLVKNGINILSATSA